MPFRVVLKYLLFFCLFLAVVIQGGIILLPVMVESRIKSGLPDDVRAFDPQFRIAGIGISRTLLRDVSLGQDLNIDLIELVYRWNGGSSFQVEKLIVSGLSLAFELDQTRRIRFNGMTFPEIGTAFNKKEQDIREKPGRAFSFEDLASFSAFIPRQVRIKHGNITIKSGENTIDVPTDVMLRVNTALGAADASIRLTPLGQSMTLSAAVDLKAGFDPAPANSLTRAELRLYRFNPGGLAPFFPELFTDFNVSDPLDIRVAGNGQGPWQIEIKGGSIKKNFLPEVKLAGFRGQAVSGQNTFSLTGKGTVTLEDDAFAPVALGIEVSAGTDDNGKPLFNVSAHSSPMDQLVVDVTKAKWLFTTKDMPQKIVVDRPVFSAAVNAGPTRQVCRFEVGAGSFRVPFPDFEMTSKHIKINGVVHLSKKGDFPLDSGQVSLKTGQTVVNTKTGRLVAPQVGLKAKGKRDHTVGGLKIDLEAGADRIKAKTAAMTFFMGHAGVSGYVGLDKAFSPSAAVTTAVKNFSVKMPEKKLTASGIDLKLPWTFPFQKKTPKGRLDINAVRYHKKKLIGVTAGLNQAGEKAISLTGRMVTPVIPGLIGGVTLAAGLDDDAAPWADLELDTRPFVFTHADLNRIAPGLDIPGTFQLDLRSQAVFSLRKNRLDTGGTLAVNAGSCEFPDMKVSATGFSGRIQLNDLFVPESLPGQSLSIETVNADLFRFNNAALRFSIEDGRSLHIENLKFNWCNGTVSTEALRLPGEDDTLDLTLYCDRLEMALLLRQLGAFDAQGDGSLSGRIPVIYKNGDIAFDNGFLFSTPGQGGRIFVKDLGRMLDGFPKGTREYSQLDLAGEALKDFEYKWAKIKMDTQADTLDVRMELDGRPAGVLPFEYNRKMNSFMRVGASSPGSRFQGIKLDVNLKLPFNRVMKFGTKLKGIL